MFELNGHMYIAGVRVFGEDALVHAENPASNTEIGPAFGYGGISVVRRACEEADTAFAAYRKTTREVRARLLECIADNIEALGDVLIERAHLETALPAARLVGERARTTGQLRLFAEVVREGSWIGARVDPASPDREPLPRADIRQRKIPLGPVAVFGASNFPLAFSVAGGDTAAALASGCPVVVKAHDAHLGTSELVGRAVTAAVADCELPAGTFSLLYGKGQGLGTALVTDPCIQAVGFTGSRSGGLALVAAAASRPQPIPVYAEMSSINPVFLLPGALQDRAAELGEEFVASLTLGAGQFCTNPGLVIAADGPALSEFLAASITAVEKVAPTTMLTSGIGRGYTVGVDELSADPTVSVLARGLEPNSPNAYQAVLLSTDADSFISRRQLHREVFGACSLVVRCRDAEQVRSVAAAVEGQLTATVHVTDVDHPQAAALLEVLELRAGRILFNGWPTGVEVGHAMVHGGPFPSTSDSRTTSVGTGAIERFLRPVAYQDVPSGLLPNALSDGNPDELWRRIDGVLGKH